MARPNPRHLALPLLLTTLTPAQTPTPRDHTLLHPVHLTQQGKPAPAQQNNADRMRNWREYQAHITAIGRPGEHALLREHARRIEHLCARITDSTPCWTAESQVTKTNYLAFKQSIDGLLRFNPEGTAAFPARQPLPFDTAEQAWEANRDAICAARANPLHTPEPPTTDELQMRLFCTVYLTQKHMEEIAHLYSRITEGTDLNLE